MPALARVEGVGWTLEVAGPLPESAVTVTRNSTAQVDPPARLEVFSRESDALREVRTGERIEPVFFENTRYEAYLRAADSGTMLTSAACRLRHAVGEVRHYSVEFGNSVGYADLSVERGGELLARLRIEVFPTKLDYREDYVRLRDEVAGVVRSLVLAAQGRTYAPARPWPARQPTVVEWVALMRRYFEELMTAVQALALDLHTRLVPTVDTREARRARRVDRRDLERLLRRSAGRPQNAEGKLGIELPRRVPDRSSRLTYDTPENRRVKAILRGTIGNLRRVAKTDATGDEDADLTAEERFFAAFRPHAVEMLGRAQRVLHGSFLSSVGDGSDGPDTSLVFARHPLYARFETVARLLNGGLDVRGGALGVGLKDIALLYEYWCFLKLVDLLAASFDLEQTSMVRHRHLGTVVVLEKGREAAVRYRDQVTGKRIEVVYDRQFSRLPTLAQRPDNVIQLASEDRLHVFDAKYRLAFDPRYSAQYGGPGPQIDDINTMHRYRDAIVARGMRGESVYHRLVQSATVLFPLDEDEEYRQHRFFRSIRAVGIGGLPFLPGGTGMVREWLGELLAAEGYGVPEGDGSAGS